MRCGEARDYFHGISWTQDEMEMHVSILRRSVRLRRGNVLSSAAVAAVGPCPAALQAKVRECHYRYAHNNCV